MNREPNTSPENRADVQAPLPADQPRDLARQIDDLPAADGAAILESLPTDLSADVTEYLDPNTAADVLVELDPRRAADIVSSMETPEASMVLEAMHPDDRVDILEHVPRSHHEALLREMRTEQADQTRELEKYAPDTAGGLMTPEVTALEEDLTVGQAISEIRRLREELEQMYYVYVVDKRRHLVGVLAMRDLILARLDARLSQIMIPNVVSVPVTMDQEDVANLFRRHNYLAVPVVDEKHRLLGIITVDDVVDVMQEKATADVQKMFGAGAEERLASPWQYSFRKRFWWLVVNLATAFLAAAVVGLFQRTIEQLVALAVYMPIVAGMGGNASAQAMAVTVRGLALGRVDRALMRHVLLRELIVGLLTGALIGLITSAVALAFHGDWKLGLVVGFSLIINHTLACTSGALIPFAMKGMGFDPAQSATIFATTVTDVAGFFSLLGLARILLT